MDDGAPSGSGALPAAPHVTPGPAGAYTGRASGGMREFRRRPDAIGFRNGSLRPGLQVDPGGRIALRQELTALARGDRAAFDPLFRRLWPILRGFASRCLPAPEADDAAQEALLRIFSRASEFDPRRDPLAWVLGITAWQVRTHRTRRRRRREEMAAEIPDRADASPSPEEAAMERDRSSALEAALSGLSPGDAETLIAYARGERPDLPGATFRKRVERALGRLRSRWRFDRGQL